MISFEVRPRRLLDWREQDGRCVLLRPRLGPSRAGRWLAGEEWEGMRGAGAGRSGGGDLPGGPGAEEAVGRNMEAFYANWRAQFLAAGADG